MIDEPGLLLDTCAAIWIVEDQGISAEATEAINRAADAGRAVFISPITAWERGLLMARGRLTSPISTKAWFDGLTGRPEVELVPLSADILIDSSFLPEPLHRDPADRILIATARALDLQIVTGDEKILAYARRGHVRAVAC